MLGNGKWPPVTSTAEKVWSTAERLNACKSGCLNASNILNLLWQQSVSALASGTWEAPGDGEIPPVFTNMAECPVWARDYDCFNAEGFKSMTATEQAQFRAEAAKVGPMPSFRQPGFCFIVQLSKCLVVRGGTWHAVCILYGHCKCSSICSCNICKLVSLVGQDCTPFFKIPNEISRTNTRAQCCTCKYRTGSFFKHHSGLKP